MQKVYKNPLVGQYKQIRQQTIILSQQFVSEIYNNTISEKKGLNADQVLFSALLITKILVTKFKHSSQDVREISLSVICFTYESYKCYKSECRPITTQV